MRNKLARQTFLLLIAGLTFIGILLLVLLGQHGYLQRIYAPTPMLQFRLNRIAENAVFTPPEVTLIQLRSISSPRLDVKTTTEIPPDIMVLHRGMPLIQTTRPFALKLSDQQWAIIKVNQPPWYTGVYLLYWASIVILIGFAFLLCYWAIRRTNQPYSFINNALLQLSQNVNSPILTPSGHADIQALANKILMIQNQLKKNLHSRTQVLAAISHDLRTPITRLKLRTELLNDDQAKDKMLKDLEEVESMLNSVLAFSKDFIQEETPTHFNFSDLVQVICDDLSDQGYTISGDISGGIIYQGRMLALKRAIQNIIDNAVKYGQKDVRVSLAQQQNKIVLTVTDQGSGVPENKLDTIFEPFVRVDAARNNEIKGSGLGLSISKEIITSHGGTIQAQNVKPTGLKVTVIL